MDKKKECGHLAVVPPFDGQAAEGLPSWRVRERWPRFFGVCPDCGEKVICYASTAHCLAGDW